MDVATNANKKMQNHGALTCQRISGGCQKKGQPSI